MRLALETLVEGSDGPRRRLWKPSWDALKSFVESFKVPHKPVKIRARGCGGPRWRLWKLWWEALEALVGGYEGSRERFREHSWEALEVPVRSSNRKLSRPS